MTFRKPLSRWALWAFAAALLLKSAMPWLASASAQLQGKTLVEVCTVYGVSLLPPPGGDGHAPEHPSDHGSEHCVLSALTLLAAAAPPTLTPATPLPQSGQPAPRHASSQAPDARAIWAARLEHGPPAIA